MKLGMINTILGSILSFFNWEGADVRPQIKPRKISALSYFCSLPHGTSCRLCFMVVQFQDHFHKFVLHTSQKMENDMTTLFASRNSQTCHVT